MVRSSSTWTLPWACRGTTGSSSETPPRERTTRAPFEGELSTLLHSGRIVLAETYPRLGYAAAIAEHLPTHPIPIGKTKRRDRELACQLLEEAEWVDESGVELGDLCGARSDEDAFDSHFTAAAVLRCAIEGLSLCSDQWIDEKVCPIPNCTKMFQGSRRGWMATSDHVLSIRIGIPISLIPKNERNTSGWNTQAGYTPSPDLLVLVSTCGNARAMTGIHGSRSRALCS